MISKSTDINSFLLHVANRTKTKKEIFWVLDNVDKNFSEKITSFREPYTVARVTKSHLREKVNP